MSTRPAPSPSTTLFIEDREIAAKAFGECHGGVGTVTCRDLIEKLPAKHFIRYIHDDILPPGTSIGYHQHPSETPFEEWYYVLSGHGVMTLDGKDYPMGPGDVSGCFANGFHGLKNTGTEDLRLLVIAARPIG
ncbi:Cupin domain-containing protein [Verrucomicrobium sp. GAS474]|uniref:cupin domain-containing protein n=1 Tax=Verrucomicrobium sp. GAS474 TaxID=1882831 RepID=UPI00087DF16D|nr:cupin domain-containing protein [Verrucomicrobium sp. GAS474]SDT98828.1 Cupin domain-containing protein [Verrucomicrobium sp. GAS474]